MKIRIALQLGLLRRARTRASIEHCSLAGLIAEALEVRLAREPVGVRGWRAVFGRATAAEVRDVDRHLAAFERVDLRTWRNR